MLLKLLKKFIKSLSIKKNYSLLLLSVFTVAIFFYLNIIPFQPFKSTFSAPTSVDVSIDVGTTEMVSKLIVGTTYVDDLLTGNSTAIARAKLNIGSAVSYHNQHIMGFGVLNPWPDPGVEDPSTTPPSTLPTNSTLAGLDARIRLAKEMGGEPVITLCCAPDWMKIEGWQRSTYNYANYTNWNASVLETAPLPEHEDEFAQLTAIIAERYDGTTPDPLNVGNTLPKVTYFQVWNEMKGLWYNPDYSDPEWSNNFDGERYTRMYNLIWNEIKEVRPDAHLGGPYFVVEATGSRDIAGVNTSAWWSADPITTRQRTILDYFLANREYADGDFLVFDRAIQSNHDTTDSVGAGTPTPLPNSRIYNYEIMLNFTHWFKDISTQAQNRSGYLGEPIWFAEDYINAKGRSAEYERAALASMLYNHTKAGTSVSLRWDPEDDSGTLGQHLVTEVNSSSSGGQTTPNHEVYMNFKNNFERGTPIYETTVTDSSIEVLASPDKIMLINKNTAPVPVDLETSDNKVSSFTLAAMEVKFLNYSDLTIGPKDYYVDCTDGNDANDGLTQGTAWKTLSNVNDAVTTDGDAAFTMNPGDTLHLKRGCTWSGTTLNARWIGTADDPITITAYGSGDLPIIKNANTIINITGDYQILEYIKTHHDISHYPYFAYDCNGAGVNQHIGWRLGFDLKSGAEHNIIRYSETSQHSLGIYVQRGANNNKILRNNLINVTGIWDRGDFVYPDGSIGKEDIGAMGVNLIGDNTEIAYNVFEDNREVCPNDFDDPEADFNGIYESNAIELYTGSNNNIHHNIAKNVRVFSETGSNPISDYIAENNVYAYNVHYSDMERAIFLNVRGYGHKNGPVLNTQVYHNTTYLTGVEGQAITCQFCGPNILTIRNNILWADFKNIYVGGSGGNPVESNNVWWSTDGTPYLQVCNPNCGNLSLGTSSVSQNPTFVNAASNNFKLQGSSTAINRGSTIPLLAGYDTDFEGTTVPIGAGPDVGAYEYDSVSTPTPTFTATPTLTPTNTPTNTPSPTSTPTPTPTGVGSTAPTAPVVTLNVASISSSIGAGSTAITIGWTNPPGAAVRWVDISANTNFSPYYHKQGNTNAGGSITSINGPDGFTHSSNGSQISLSPGTTYYARVWNGVHSVTYTSFSIPQTPSNTPIPTSTLTPTLTNTPVPTSTPVITMSALSPDPHADNTPLFSGTATSSTANIVSVEYQMNSTSGTWEDCTATSAPFSSATEGFTCTVSSLLDGLQTIFVQATDSNGLTTLETDSFTIDTEAPFISVASFDNDLTNDSTPTFSGNAVDISSIIDSVEYQIGDTAPGSWSSCTADDSTYDENSEDFTCQVSSPLTDGSKTVYFRATDNLSHVTTDYEILSVDIDTTAAVITLVDLSPTITSDTTPMLSGTAIDASSTVASVQYQIGGTSPGTWSSCSAIDGIFDEANESYNCTVTSGLSGGSHTMYVRSTDAVGNINSDGSLDSSTFTIDIVAPVLTIVALSPDPNNDVTPSIGGTAIDANSNIATVEFQMDSTSGSWESCSAISVFNSSTEGFTCTPTTLTNGSHTMYFRATDSLGNITAGTYPSDTFVIDNTPPEITLNALSPNPTNDNTPTFTGTVIELIDTVSTVEYQIDGTGPGSWNACTATDGSFDEGTEGFTCTITTLSDDNYVIYIRAADSQGNQTASNFTQQAFTVDTVDPINPGVNLIPISPDPTNNLSIAIGGTATDADGTIVDVEYQLDGTGGAWLGCFAGDGNFNSNTESFNCNVGSTVSQGSHTIYVRATDNDDLNSESVEDTFVFDTVVSTITLSALSPDPTTDTTPIIGGTAVDTSSSILSVQFQIGATTPGSWSSCTALDGDFDEATESFSCTPSSALTDGSNTMFVRTTDEAGNVTTGTDIKSDTFVVDTNTPTLTIDEPSNITKDSTPVFTGNAVDVNGTVALVEYQVDSTSGTWNECIADVGSFDSNNEDFTCQIGASALSDGAHTIYFRATDSLDNITTSFPQETFTLDASAPSVTITALAQNPISDTTPSFTGTVIDNTSNIATVEYQINNIFGTWNSCSATSGSFDSNNEDFTCNVGSTLPDGVHTIYIRTTDNLGNETSPDETLTDYTQYEFTVDTTGPTLTLTALSPDPTFDNTPTFTGTIEDTYSAISNVQYQVGSTAGTWSSCSSDDGNFDTSSESYTCTTAELSDGVNTIYVRGLDILSNITSAGNYRTDTFTINARGPVISDNEVSKTDTTAEITWETDEAGSTKVQYGLLSDDISEETTETNTINRVTDHTIELTNLVACTTYHYVARSIDENGLETIGDTQSFTTSGCTGNASISMQTYDQLSTIGDSLTLLNDGTNGLTLTVPSGYFADDLYFQLKKLTKSSVLSAAAAPSGMTAVTDFIYDLQAYSDVNTSEDTFDEDLTVQMSYSNSNIQNFSENSLQIYYWSGTTWIALTGCTKNINSNTISCPTDHFTVFGLFGIYTPPSNNNSGNSGSSSGGGGSSNNVCSAQKPQSIPHLFQVDRTGNKAKLHFAPAVNPYDGYILSFGKDETAEEYNGIFDIRNSTGAIVQEVDYLDPGTTYYFKVRAKNGCTAGDWSNIIGTRGVSANSTAIVSYYPNWIETATYYVNRTYTQAVNTLPGKKSTTSAPANQTTPAQPQPQTQTAPPVQRQAAPSQQNSAPVTQQATPQQSGNWFTGIINRITSIFK